MRLSTRFPDELVREIERDAGVAFIGNCARSGTEILEELGEEHLRTGKPILYTSADSVLQIAAHEEVIPVERLYEICEVARSGRGSISDRARDRAALHGRTGKFSAARANRHDFSLRPPRTVLNALAKTVCRSIGVGKISDIFAGRGIAESFPTTSNRDGMERIDELWQTRKRRAPFRQPGRLRHALRASARCRRLRAALARVRPLARAIFSSAILPNDLVIITADHGNDPTFRGTDHTREEVPLLVLHGGESRDLGTRETFRRRGRDAGGVF